VNRQSDPGPGSSSARLGQLRQRQRWAHRHATEDGALWDEESLARAQLTASAARDKLALLQTRRELILAMWREDAGAEGLPGAAAESRVDAGYGSAVGAIDASTRCLQEYVLSLDDSGNDGAALEAVVEAEQFVEECREDMSAGLPVFTPEYRMLLEIEQLVLVREPMYVSPGLGHRRDAVMAAIDSLRAQCTALQDGRASSRASGTAGRGAPGSAGGSRSSGGHPVRTPEVSTQRVPGMLRFSSRSGETADLPPGVVIPADLVAGTVENLRNALNGARYKLSSSDFEVASQLRTQQNRQVRYCLAEDGITDLEVIMVSAHVTKADKSRQPRPGDVHAIDRNLDYDKTLNVIRDLCDTCDMWRFVSALAAPGVRVVAVVSSTEGPAVPELRRFLQSREQARARAPGRPEQTFSGPSDFSRRVHESVAEFYPAAGGPYLLGVEAAILADVMQVLKIAVREIFAPTLYQDFAHISPLEIIQLMCEVEPDESKLRA
jgi:hypothetical protein